MISLEVVKKYLRETKQPTFREFCLLNEILSEDLERIYEEHGEEFRALEYLDLAIKAEVDKQCLYQPNGKRVDYMAMRKAVFGDNLPSRAAMREAITRGEEKPKLINESGVRVLANDTENSEGV